MATIKDKIFDALMERVTLFTDGEDGFAAYEVNGSKISEKISSKKFKKYCRKIARAEKINYGDNVLKEAIEDLESEALFEGHKCTIYNRIGKTDTGNILVNPAYESGDIIEIGPNGWNIRTPYTHEKTLQPITPFMLRTKGMLELPYPEKNKGDIYDLQEFIRTEDDEEKFLLMVAYIIQSFFYDGPFPVLVLTAQSGSGKSFTSTIIKNVIDPHVAPILSVPKNAQAMFSTAGVSWVMAYDNFSSVSLELSNLFCRMSTGGGTIDRELYSNNEAFIYSFKRPAIVNGITDFFAQSDILQRALIFDIPIIQPEERKEERKLLQDFHEKQPGIFYDVLDLISATLKIIPDIEVMMPTRMADFCRVGEATSRAMGHDDNFFMDTYIKNLRQANDIALDASVIAPVVKAYMEKEKYWKGSPSSLLKILTDYDPEKAKHKYWPKTAKVLSGTLKRLAQNFRETGLQVELGRDRDGRWIELTWTKAGGLYE